MNEFKTIIESAYYLSGPVIAVLALWGLKHLKISKDNAKLSAKREAFRLAAEQCHKFTTDLIPLFNAFDREMESKKLDLLTKSEVEVSTKGFKVKPYLKDLDIEASREVLVKCLDIVNGLESFALYFTTGVAAEVVAYNSVGHTYCREVKMFLPLLAVATHKEKVYHHLLKLFFLWHNRSVAEKLLLEKTGLEERLRDIDNKTISPMGLE